jgi:hypothetical protein
MRWIDDLRVTLLISLSFLLVAILYRRFKRKVLADDLPAPLHAELVGLQVAYHPQRLRVEVSMPSRQELHPRLVDRAHVALHTWPSLTLGEGEHTFEVTLPALPDGEHFFELATSTQRTVRVFRLQP